MFVLDGAEIRRRAPMIRLVDSVAAAFRTKPVVPARQITPVPGGSGDRLFGLMPAFDLDGAGAVKLVTLFPDNAAAGRPTVQAAIVVFSETGTPMALLDGMEVTHLRTGAASGLASRYLSKVNSAHLVIIGTGALAPSMAIAHCTVRPIVRVTVWGRRPDRAEVTAEIIRGRLSRGVEVCVAKALDEAVSTADIISCATSSSEPVLQGKWLSPGAFVDLVGSFSPTKREADDAVMHRARIFVDTFEGALAEAGDILQPLERRVISRQRIEGELSDLICGRVSGRTSEDEIIVFKSVGSAIEDLAAARMIMAS